MYLLFELQHKKTGLCDFRPGLTQSSLFSLRRRLEAGENETKKKRHCTICEVETKALSFCIDKSLFFS